MKSFANLAMALSLTAIGTLSLSSAAQAQDAAAPAADSKLAVGTAVYDSAGASIGTVASNDGTNVVIQIGDQQVALPIASFGASEKGPALTITLEQLQAGIAQQKAASEAALSSALTTGAAVKSNDGTTTLATVKSANADGVIVTTTDGRDVRLPTNSFFMAPHGLSSSFTAEQFAAAIAQVEAAPTTSASNEAPAPAPAE